ncbi:RNA-binding protein 20 [Nymphon striatum]|nr:RNA-binding protein 20 [Nymphon striatum]
MTLWGNRPLYLKSMGSFEKMQNFGYSGNMNSWQGGNQRSMNSTQMAPRGRSMYQGDNDFPMDNSRGRYNQMDGDSYQDNMYDDGGDMYMPPMDQDIPSRAPLINSRFRDDEFEYNSAPQRNYYRRDEIEMSLPPIEHPMNDMYDDWRNQGDRFNNDNAGNMRRHQNFRTDITRRIDPQSRMRFKRNFQDSPNNMKNKFVSNSKRLFIISLLNVKGTLSKILLDLKLFYTLMMLHVIVNFSPGLKIKRSVSMSFYLENFRRRKQTIKKKTPAKKNENQDKTEAQKKTEEKKTEDPKVKSNSTEVKKEDEETDGNKSQLQVTIQQGQSGHSVTQLEDKPVIDDNVHVKCQVCKTIHQSVEVFRDHLKTTNHIFSVEKLIKRYVFAAGKLCEQLKLSNKAKTKSNNMASSMHTFLNLPPPEKRPKKTKEDTLARQQKYEKTQRKRVFLKTWSENRPWLKYVPQPTKQLTDSPSTSKIKGSSNHGMFCDSCIEACNIDELANLAPNFRIYRISGLSGFYLYILRGVHCSLCGIRHNNTHLHRWSLQHQASVYYEHFQKSGKTDITLDQLLLIEAVGHKDISDQDDDNATKNDDNVEVGANNAEEVTANNAEEAANTEIDGKSSEIENSSNKKEDPSSPNTHIAKLNGKPWNLGVIKVMQLSLSLVYTEVETLLSEIKEISGDKIQPIGQDNIIDTSGYFCKLCRVFFASKTNADVLHCKSKKHREKYQKVQELIKLKAEKKAKLEELNKKPEESAVKAESEEMDDNPSETNPDSKVDLTEIDEEELKDALNDNDLVDDGSTTCTDKTKENDVVNGSPLLESTDGATA